MHTIPRLPRIPLGPSEWGSVANPARTGLFNHFQPLEKARFLLSSILWTMRTPGPFANSGETF
jgi:hypothetical protein